MSDVTKVLAELANAVVGHFDIKTLLDRIIETTMNAFHAEVCSIFLKNEKDSDSIQCVAGSGFAKNIVNVATYRKGEGFTGMVFATGNEYNIKSLKELQTKKGWEGKYDYSIPSDGESKYRNGMYLPLKMKEQILGVIKVENKIESYGDNFTEEDFVVFKTIANVIALTIENVILHQKAEEQLKTILNALSEVASNVVGQFDIKTLLAQIIDTSMKALHAEVCSIFLEDKEKHPGVIKCVAGSGFTKNIIGIAEYKIGEGFTGTVAKIGKEFKIDSREELESLKDIWIGRYDKFQWKSGQSEFRNLLAIPLKIKDQTLGVIKVENKSGDSPFTGEDLTVFKTIANVIALAIENASLHQKVEEQIKKEGDAWKEVSFRAGHKMGNALFGLRGNIDWLNIISSKELLNKEEIGQSAQETQESLNAANRIIKEFKDYARPDELNLEFVDVNQVLEKAIAESEKSVQEVNFKRDYADKLPKIKIDIMKFKQSISELIENACCLMNNKGQLTVYSNFSSDQDKYRVGTSDDEDFISVIVKDTGKGIPTENKEKIFLPFFSTTAKGTGLGLAIVKQYIEKHGGKIVEIGEYGQGAEFLIVMPVIKH